MTISQSLHNINTYFSFHCIIGCSAFQMGQQTRMMARRSAVSMNTPVPSGLTSPGANMKPMADGTFKEAGAFLPEYVLENQNGARAVCRTYGGNLYSWKTKEGIEVMGVRKDADRSDSKPYAGGAPHCFPQVCCTKDYE